MDLMQYLDFADLAASPNPIPRRFAEYLLREDAVPIPPRDVAGPLQDVRLKHAVEAAVASVLEMCDAVTLYDGKADLYLPFRYYEQTLVYLTQGFMTLRDRPHDLELRCLRRLLDARLPALEDLSPHDCLNARLEEDAFDRWRAALSRGLERLIAIEPNVLEPRNETVRLIREELLEAESRLKSDLKRRKFKTLLGSATTDMSIGAATTLGANAVLSSWSRSVGAGIIAICARSIINACRSGSTPPASQLKAWSKHYATFRIAS